MVDKFSFTQAISEDNDLGSNGHYTLFSLDLQIDIGDNCLCYFGFFYGTNGQFSWMLLRMFI